MGPDATEVPLVVVLGAGASQGAADAWSWPVPPLTVDLFDENRYGELLEGYELAHQAGRYIEGERALDGALGLEKVLHGLRTSEHEHHRRMAYAVPPYLQHLLHSVSDAHYGHAFRYDRLIERLLRLPYVCFVTLNYDVLLDRRLAAHHGLNDFEDYIGDDKNWSLIKLHGSVNWFYRVPVNVEGWVPVEEPSVSDQDLNCRPPSSSLQDLRGSVGGRDRYPALALPEGPDDRLVLPSRHIWWIKQRLGSTPELDLLVIGYSGLDTEALELIRSFDRKIRHATIVNQSGEAAIEVRERLLAADIKPVWTETAPGTFGHWADGGGLDRLVDQYGGPYPDAY